MFGSMARTTSNPARLAAYVGDLAALAGIAILAIDLLQLRAPAGNLLVAVDLSLVLAGLAAHRVALSMQRDAAALALAVLIAGGAPSVLVLQRWWIAVAAGATAAGLAPHAVPPRRAAVWIFAGILLSLTGLLQSWVTGAVSAAFVLALGLISRALAQDLQKADAREAQVHERAVTEERLKSAELLVRLAQYEGRSAGHHASALRTALSRRLGTIGAIASSLARELRETPTGVTQRSIERAEQLAQLAAGGESREQETTLSLIWSHVAEALTGRLLPVHHLEVAIADTLPPVAGTAQEWQHILTAAVENALHAMPKGGVVRIRAGPSEPPGFVGIVVEDTGPGTSDDLLGRARRHGDELSLGTAAALVEVLGGSVDLQFVQGKGTRLTIVAPRYVRPAQPASTPAQAGAMRLDGTVLLADDDKDVRRALARLLESFGLIVVQADTGTVALAQFTAAPDRFRAAILDVVMEGTPVGDVVAGIRTQRPRFPVVLVSGYDTQRYVDGVLALGGVRFLRKPIQREDLFATLRDLATVRG